MHHDTAWYVGGDGASRVPVHPLDLVPAPLRILISHTALRILRVTSPRFRPALTTPLVPLALLEQLRDSRVGRGRRGK